MSVDEDRVAAAAWPREARDDRRHVLVHVGEPIDEIGIEGT